MEEKPLNLGAHRHLLGLWFQLWGSTIWAATVLVIATYLFLLTNDTQYAQRVGRLGPAFWPKAILMFLMIMAAFDCLVEARKARERSSHLQDQVCFSADSEKRDLKLLLLGLGLTPFYICLIAVFGFPLANILFMLAFMLIGGFNKPITAFLISRLGTLCLVVLFVRIVYVSLPLGVAPFCDLTLLLYSLLGII